VSGMHVAAVIAAVLLAGVAVLAVRLLNHVPPTGAAPKGPEAADTAKTGEAADASGLAEPGEDASPAPEPVRG